MFGYIGRNWRGENSLAWAYWFNGGVLNGVATGTIAVLEASTDIFDKTAPALLIVVGALALWIWSCVGIWRSASNYTEQALTSVPKTSAFWGHTAKVMVIFGLLRGVADLQPIASDIAALMDVGDSEIATQFYIQTESETDIVLSGYINEDSVEAVKNAFLEDERLIALSLDSPGGFLDAAFDLADFIELRGIIIVATNQCESSCLLLLAAAETSAVTPDTSLVFHHPEATVDFASTELRDVFNDEVDEYYARFQRYGVPEEALKEFRRGGTTSISIGEAYNADIVDMIWEPTEGKVYEIEAVCEQVDCFSSPVKFP